MLVEVDTATTVVPEAIPVPDTVLPTTIEEADDTDVTTFSYEIRVPVDVVTEVTVLAETASPTAIKEATADDTVTVEPLGVTVSTVEETKVPVVAKTVAPTEIRLATDADSKVAVFELAVVAMRVVITALLVPYVGTKVGDTVGADEGTKLGMGVGLSAMYVGTSVGAIDDGAEVGKGVGLCGE